MKNQPLKPKNIARRICTGTLTVILLSCCCLTAVSASEQSIPDTEQETQQSEQLQDSPISEEVTETEAEINTDTEKTDSEENTEGDASDESTEGDASECEDDSVSETSSSEEEHQQKQDEEEFKTPEILTVSAEYLLGSGNSLTLQLLLNGFTVTGVRANGNAVDGKYLTVSAEGTVTISAEYLERLEAGTAILAVDLTCEDRTYSLTCTLTITELESSRKDRKKDNTDSSESDTAADSSTDNTAATESSETAESTSSDSAEEYSGKTESKKSSSGSSKTGSKGNSSGGKKNSAKSGAGSQEDGQSWLESCSGEYTAYYVNLSLPGNSSAEKTDNIPEAARIVIDQDVIAGYAADGTELFCETYVYSETDENTGALLFLSETEGPYHCLLLSGEAGSCLFFRCGSSVDEVSMTYSTSSQIACGLLLDSALTEEEQEEMAAKVFRTLINSLSGQSAGTSR